MRTKAQDGRYKVQVLSNGMEIIWPSDVLFLVRNILGKPSIPPKGVRKWQRARDVIAREAMEKIK